MAISLLDNDATLKAELNHLNGQHKERGIPSNYYDVSILAASFLHLQPRFYAYSIVSRLNILPLGPIPSRTVHDPSGDIIYIFYQMVTFGVLQIY